MYAITVAHPNLRVDVLDRLELGNGRTMMEVSLHSPEPRDWGGELRSLSSVEEVEVIDVSPEATVCRVTFRGSTYIPLLRRLRILRRFPFPVHRGVATWTVVGPADKVHVLLRRLAGRAPAVRLVAIRYGPVRDGLALLTLRQQEILDRAMEEGYFEVPRRISLTRLAPQLGVAASTLSVTLAVIERKIVGTLAAGAGSGRTPNAERLPDPPERVRLGGARRPAPPTQSP
ncbi:MAG TPA: helix-turn-helix domain-containing protein [Thermoplasmata archaeon]|nr:helix-turn-helix domain-containing protein [Thermoplasmata archaeon]